MSLSNLAFAEIIYLRSIDKLKPIFQQIDENTLVLLDVDDTLITPKSNLFRYKNNPHRFLIDELKKNQHQYPKFDNILSQWRLQRKIQLVSEEWPSLIEEAKNAGAFVFALTQMDTGSLGAISSMETWRYQELRDNNIHFSNSFGNSENKILKKDKRGYAVFHKGIIMTGPFSKVEMLELLLQEMNPDKIICVDDREDHITNLNAFASQKGIAFTGIVFKAAEDIQGTPHPDIVAIQKKYLVEEAKWLEDDMAEEILQSLRERGKGDFSLPCGEG